MEPNQPPKYTEPIPSPFQKFDAMGADYGHDSLLHDLQELVRQADQYEFHDYKNKKYPMPKMALVTSLEQIIKRVKDGFYDNKTST